MLTALRLHRRLARNVRRLRCEQGLPVQQAAAAAGVHWRHWQKVEAAETNATMVTVCRIAVALGVDPAELVRPPARKGVPG
jgi:predicted transcriptional regulator